MNICFPFTAVDGRPITEKKHWSRSTQESRCITNSYAIHSSIVTELAHAAKCKTLANFSFHILPYIPSIYSSAFRAHGDNFANKRTDILYLLRATYSDTDKLIYWRTCRRLSPVNILWRCRVLLVQLILFTRSCGLRYTSTAQNSLPPVIE